MGFLHEDQPFGADAALKELSGEMGQEETGTLGDYFHEKKEINDPFIRRLFEILDREFPELRKVKIVFISPEEEPFTGGIFRVMEDAQGISPTVFLVLGEEDHWRRVLEAREASVKIVANLLSIDWTTVTPEFLRAFILLHEFGHAKDFMKNYFENEEYEGEQIGDAWREHYLANLFFLPIPGYDPVDLREALSEFSTPNEFFLANPSLAKYQKQFAGMSFQELIEQQEKSYRSSSYEQYADEFARAFLVSHGREFGMNESLMQALAQGAQKKAA